VDENYRILYQIIKEVTAIFTKLELSKIEQNKSKMLNYFMGYLVEIKHIKDKEEYINILQDNERYSEFLNQFLNQIKDEDKKTAQCIGDGTYKSRKDFSMWADLMCV